jgi:hypothetical protein
MLTSMLRKQLYDCNIQQFVGFEQSEMILVEFVGRKSVNGPQSRTDPWRFQLQIFGTLL